MSDYSGSSGSLGLKKLNISTPLSRGIEVEISRDFTVQAPATQIETTANQAKYNNGSRACLESEHQDCGEYKA